MNRKGGNGLLSDVAFIPCIWSTFIPWICCRNWRFNIFTDQRYSGLISEGCLFSGIPIVSEFPSFRFFWSNILVLTRFSIMFDVGWICHGVTGKSSWEERTSKAQWMGWVLVGYSAQYPSFAATVRQFLMLRVSGFRNIFLSWQFACLNSLFPRDFCV